MFDNYIIEIRSSEEGITVQAGLVVRDGRWFRFFSATSAFDRLEGQLFDNPRAAQRAALRQVTERAQPFETGRDRRVSKQDHLGRSSEIRSNMASPDAPPLKT
jgi:hypothetical protein